VSKGKNEMKSRVEIERDIALFLAEGDPARERDRSQAEARRKGTHASSSAGLRAAEIMSDRAYSAMYASEQRFGYNSPEHRVAWSVFSDAQSVLRDDGAPHVFQSNAERSHALDLVEARCNDKRGRKTLEVAGEIVAMTRSHRLAGSSQ